jgi:hypothetical protein
MKVLTFSRHFPKGHLKAGQSTWFVEKVWKSIWDSYQGASNPLHPFWEVYDGAFPMKFDAKENIHQHQPKHHTIRAGNRWKAGDMASLRVWSDKPYRSKQIEFAQVEIKKVWQFGISHGNYSIDTIQHGSFIPGVGLEKLANNDGLHVDDFWSWFDIHPKKEEQVFAGQIICWNDKIEY